MPILSLLIGPISKLLDRILPDPKIAEAAKMKLLELHAQGSLAELDGEVKENLAAANIVLAEANSKHWLAADWRPLIMMGIALALILEMLGWTGAKTSADVLGQAWDTLKIGLGGYVVMHPSSLNAIAGIAKGMKAKS